MEEISSLMNNIPVLSRKPDTFFSYLNDEILIEAM